MHALCTIVAKNMRLVNNIMNEMCDCGNWDYYTIGGRYINCIPVRKNTKQLFPSPVPIDVPIEVNGFPYADTLQNNPNCKYVNVARVRNIDIQEMQRLDDMHLLNAYKPYSFILCENENECWQERLIENEGNLRLLEFIREPRHSFYYVVTVDYHF